MSIIHTLWTRIKEKGLRAHSNDNISEILQEGDREALIDELTPRFERVLDGLLIDIYDDPNAKGTARRLAKMYVNELMFGRFYPEPVITAFPNEDENRYTGMLVVRAEIKSMCSHHHQPVTGLCFIGVIPGKKVIGLSKYARIAHHCARRGTLQEELATDITNKIIKATESEDVGVYIQAEHGCMVNRGVMAHSSLTQTTVLRGDFLNDPSVKKEFISNISMQLHTTK